MRRSNPIGVARSPRLRTRAFTLIELLVAAAIAALLMMTAIPYVREVRKDPLVRAVNSLVDACREARLQAILKDRPYQVVIYDNGGAIAVEPVPQASGGFGPTNVGGESVPADPSAGSGAGGGSKNFESRIDDEVAFRTLYVNGRDRWTESAVTVRFYPNGTCDALDAELQWLRHDVRRISLDILTGHPTVGGVQ